MPQNRWVRDVITDGTDPTERGQLSKMRSHLLPQRIRRFDNQDTAWMKKKRKRHDYGGLSVAGRQLNDSWIVMHRSVRENGVQRS